MFKMKYKQTPNLPWRKIEDRAVIISPKTGQVHELDEVASFLWVLADGVKTLEETTALLMEEFEVEKTIALQDTREFYHSLENLGLIQCQS
jgi:hypothetical protein